MSFASAVVFTINDLEGGYKLTTYDVPTYAGITEDLARKMGYQWNPPFDPVEVANIYRAAFWEPCRCDEIPEPADAVHFQCAVNVGQPEATRILQRAIGATVDGDFGPKTLAAVMATPRGALPELILRFQSAYYRGIGGQFLQGWLNRVEKVRQAVQEGRL